MDTQNPSVPQNLTANSTAIREITLNWQPSTDNTGIREYVISYGTQTVNTGSAASSYSLKGLPLNSDFTFTIRARDLGGNLSGSSNAASGNTFVTGLYYEHATGAFSDIDLINWSFVEFKGKVNNFTLTPRTQEDYFNFEFEGYLYIITGGPYEFQTTSDDGSRVTLNDTIVVDNDGLHGTKTVSGAPVTLTSGGQRINVKYFENNGSQNLTVRYKGPDTGNSWVAIPDAALKSGDASGSMAMARVGEEKMLDQENESSDLNVYPNPLRSSDDLTIASYVKEGGPAQVRIFDFMGNSYYENTLAADDLNQGVKIMPSTKLSDGLYIITILQDKRLTRKVIMVKD